MARPLKILPDIAGAYSLIIFISLVLFAGKKVLNDGDPFWHIKAGVTMLERGSILNHDIFSHTALGKSWTAHEWLSEIIMGGLSEAAGLPGVVTFYFLLASLTFWILFKTARLAAGEWLSFFSVSLAFSLALSHLLARPHLFSWFLGATTIFCLQKGGRWPYILPLLTAVWANLHGGFLIGLVLQGIFITGRILDRLNSESRLSQWRDILQRNKTLLFILFLSSLAACVNPFGYHLYLFPLHVTKAVFSTNIGEWLSPDLQGLWYFRIYLLLLILLLFLCGQRISWTNRLLVLFFVNAALTHARHISLAGIFLVPFWIEALSPWAQNLSGRFTRQDRPQLALSSYSGPVVTVLLGAVIITLTATNWLQWKKVSEILFPLPDEYSTVAIQFLKENPPQGKMFNEYSWGGYLVAALGPELKVFIDGRADMYGEEIFSDYLKITGIDEKADGLLDKYGIQWIIFPPGKPLVRYLLAKGDWNEVYRDSQAVILVRQAPSGP